MSTRLEKAILALKEIVNPIPFMQERVRSDERLDGEKAVAMADSPNYLKRIASDALVAIDAPEQSATLPELIARYGCHRKYWRVGWSPQRYAYVHEADDQIYSHTPLHAFGRVTATDYLASDWLVVKEPA